MSGLVSRAAMEDALRRRGGAVDTVEGLIEVLNDVAGSVAILSAGEQAFLTQAGVPEEAFTPQAVGQARLKLAALAARVERSAAVGLTTTEVAERLRTQPANVRRLLAARALYAAGRTVRAEHVFPGWQFVDDRPLPHLQDVIAALPVTMHPLDVEAFMVEKRELLGNRSPIEWLATGGAPAPVVELADEETWA